MAKTENNYSACQNILKTFDFMTIFDSFPSPQSKSILKLPYMLLPEFTIKFFRN